VLRWLPRGRRGAVQRRRAEGCAGESESCAVELLFYDPSAQQRILVRLGPVGPVTGPVRTQAQSSCDCPAAVKAATVGASRLPLPSLARCALCDSDSATLSASASAAHPPRHARASSHVTQRRSGTRPAGPGQPKPARSQPPRPASLLPDAVAAPSGPGPSRSGPARAVSTEGGSSRPAPPSSPSAMAHRQECRTHTGSCAGGQTVWPGLRVWTHMIGTRTRMPSSLQSPARTTASADARARPAMVTRTAGERRNLRGNGRGTTKKSGSLVQCCAVREGAVAPVPAAALAQAEAGSAAVVRAIRVRFLTAESVLNAPGLTSRQSPPLDSVPNLRGPRSKSPCAPIQISVGPVPRIPSHPAQVRSRAGPAPLGTRCVS
jgi:hypothetical protein